MKRLISFLKKAISFSLLNFAAPLAFFVLYNLSGPKPAIALAVVSTLIQGGVHIVRRIPMSPFYLTASGFTVVFGGIDLLIASPRFYRLEPFAQNFVLGWTFIISLFTRVSILGWFIAGLPASFRPRFGTEMGGYLRRLTLIWGIYFLAKSLVFLYLAFRVNLGNLILLRSIIGGGTLFMMVAGEVIYRTKIRRPHPNPPDSRSGLPHSMQNGSVPPFAGNPSNESRSREESPRPH